MYDILEFLNFLYLQEITQQIFFNLRFLVVEKYFDIVLKFFPYLLGENKLL